MKHEYSLSRRALLRHSIAIGAVATAAGTSRLWAQASGVTSNQHAPEFVEVETVEGRLKGVREKDLLIFRGVRYAAAPVGHARFKAPLPLSKWKGTRDAMSWGHPALQAPGQVFG